MLGASFASRRSPDAGHAPVAEDAARLSVVDSGRHRIWADNAADFRTAGIAAIHHDFHRHPLMQLPRLEQLAERLWPLGQCRFMAPGARDTSSLDESMRMRNPSGYKIAETFRRIEEPASWISLYNVETDPEYRQFLADVVEAGRPLLQGDDQDVQRICGYVFISAPPSVTPFHVDRENNFWLQIRGRKTIAVWDRRDRDVVAAIDIEKFLLDATLTRVRLDETYRERGREFPSGPGDGVLFRSTSPHLTRSERDWVAPGDGVAISIGVVFYTRETLRLARVHLCNRALRRMGLPEPAAPGRHRVLDALKEPVGRALAARRRDWPDVTAWSFGLERR
jgi:hypothetical protein